VPGASPSNVGGSRGSLLPREPAPGKAEGQCIRSRYHTRPGGRAEERGGADRAAKENVGYG